MTRTERKEERRQYRLLVKQSQEPKPPLEIRWWLLWHTPLKEHLANLYKSIKPYLTVKMALCFGMAWVLVDGSPYLMVIFGQAFHVGNPFAIMIFGHYYYVGWLEAIGWTLEWILWFPLTAEKPFVVIPLGVWFYKVLFRKTIDKRRLIK